MKSRRFDYEFRSNASRGHRLVGDLLRSGPLSRYKLFQEYPVNRVNPSVENGRYHYDWVILDLRIVIEIHGEFHDQAITIGHITQEEAEARLRESQQRDSIKEQAAKEAGFGYVVIWYWELVNLTSEELVRRCMEASLFAGPAQPLPPSRKEIQKEKARQIRKERYAQAKAYRKERLSRG